MQDPSAPTDPTPAPAPTPDDVRPRAGRRRVWGAVAALAVAVGAVAVQAGRSDDPPLLRVALGAAAGGTAEAAADLSMAAPVTYRAAGDLPLGGGEAPAYEVAAEVDAADVAELADALGLAEELERTDAGWTAEGPAGRLDVQVGVGAPTWWYGGAVTRSSDPSGGTSGCEGGPAVDCAPVTTLAPAPAPVDLPSEAEARAAALEVLTAGGLDEGSAAITAEALPDAWLVTAEVAVDGRPVGPLASAAIGTDGAVQYANGTWLEVRRLGDYPLVDTRAAIDRLNAAWGATAFAGGVGGPEVGATDTTAVAEDAIVVDAAPPACAPQPDGRELCEQPVTTTVQAAVTDRPEGPAPVLDGAEDCTVSPAVDPAASGAAEDVVAANCVDVAVPAEPTEVVLTEVTPALLLTSGFTPGDPTYLLPAYRFGNDDGVQLDVHALADEALAPLQPPAPVPGDGDDPTDVDSVDPMPADGGAGASSPGFAGTTGCTEDGACTGAGTPTDPAAPTGPVEPCPLPEPGPGGEVPAIACLEPAAP